MDDIRFVSTLPVDQSYTGAIEIKVVYEIADSSLYFVNGNEYTFHEDFCSSVLGYWMGNYQFNKTQYYQNRNRKFLLAKLLFFKAQHKWVLEFIASDMIHSTQVSHLLYEVGRFTYFGKDIKVLVHRQDLHNELLSSGVPVISEEALYGELKYQAVNVGNSYGYLRILELSDLDHVVPGAKDIVVVNGTPNEIPPIAGMLTSQFQTPLSHITLLCRNRNTPLAAYRRLDELSLDKLNGAPVKFSVFADSLYVQASTDSMVESYWQNKRPPKVVLKLDTSVTGLIPMSKITARSFKSVGAKAANFGSLQKALSFTKANAKTPEGAFAIPMVHYFSHLTRHRLNSFIKLKLDAIAHGEKYSSALREIREKIEEVPIDQDLLRLVEEEIAKHPRFNKWRFRSSTNAEDLNSFNGAGLYESRSVHLGSKKKTIERAIKRVWASCWSERAFLERNYYKIDHSHVGMGILVHRSFPDELANGVAISSNIYDPYNAGIVINVQLGEHSVVSPDSGVVCEQIVYQAPNQLSSSPRSVQYLSRSSITGGEPVLSDEQLDQLAEAITKVKYYFYENVNVHWINKPSGSTGFDRFIESEPYSGFALDIEFKIDGENNNIYLKQVRPYK